MRSHHLRAAAGAGVYSGNIAVVHQSSLFITAYPWTSGQGFGTKYSDPSTLPTSTGYSVAWSPDGSDIAVAHLNSP